MSDEVMHATINADAVAATAGDGAEPLPVEIEDDDPENIDPADLDVEVAPFPGDEAGDYDQDDDRVVVPLDVDEL